MNDNWLSPQIQAYSRLLRTEMPFMVDYESTFDLSTLGDRIGLTKIKSRQKVDKFKDITNILDWE